MRGLLAFVVPMAVLLPTVVDAADAAGGTVRVTAKTDMFQGGSIQFLVYAGSLLADNEPQLKGLGNRYTLGMGLSADLNRPGFVGLDVELLSLSREFDTPVAAPFWGTLDNTTHLDTAALLLGVRLFSTQTEPLRAYVCGGLGYYKTTMRVNGSLLGVPGSYEESDSAWNPYVGAGLRYRFNTWSVGLDYRHTDLKGDFSDFGISNAKIGGDSYMLGIGWRF